MRNYRLITSFVAPLIPLWLQWRKLSGKEDHKRLRERYGFASKARPKGTLVWLHAASVGESTSVLILIQKIRERYPDIHLLLTTGTVTSANLMHKRLPKEVIHQYVPIDTFAAVRRFLRHWRPDIALWVESELWPNLVMETNEAEAFMGIINGRMSKRSFEGWKKRPEIITPMLSSFNIVFAQTIEDGKRLKEFGAKDVLCVGNLKYDAAFLPCNEEELIELQSDTQERKIWLAASTHPGEELLIAKAHALLSISHPNLLTIIVPRHPQRGSEIAESLSKSAKVALRSQTKTITPDTKLYIADTLGELGLFYRLCDIVFMGGSLVKHGGQNPLEPGRLSCAILAGTHTHNFLDMYADMEKSGCCIRVANSEELAQQVSQLLDDASARGRLQSAVKRWMEGKGGTAQRLLDELEPVFAPQSFVKALP